MKRGQLVWILAVSVVCLFLAACSDDDSEKPAETNEQPNQEAEKSKESEGPEVTKKRLPSPPLVTCLSMTLSMKMPGQMMVILVLSQC